MAIGTTSAHGIQTSSPLGPLNLVAGGIKIALMHQLRAVLRVGSLSRLEQHGQTQDLGCRGRFGEFHSGTFLLPTMEAASKDYEAGTRAARSLVGLPILPRIFQQSKDGRRDTGFEPVRTKDARWEVSSES